jgi:uncharacterized membrane protein YhaH (DUF805 family)
MIFCSGCGAQMHASALACPTCGKPNAAAAIAPPADSGWFSFRGRISRKTYWLHYVLPITAAALVLAVLDSKVGAHGVLSGLFTLATFVPSLAAAVKRFHDRNNSGWRYLLMFIPIIGVIWMGVEIGFLRGTRGPNRFGGSPLPEDGFQAA